MDTSRIRLLAQQNWRLSGYLAAPMLQARFIGE